MLWDITFFIPIVFILRTPYLIIPCIVVALVFCDWFINDFAFQFFTYISLHLLRSIVLLPLRCIQLIIQIIMILHSIVTFIRGLINQPGGRSSYQILSNQRHSALHAKDFGISPSLPTSRVIRRQYLVRGKKYLPRLPENLYINLTYQT